MHIQGPAALTAMAVSCKNGRLFFIAFFALELLFVKSNILMLCRVVIIFQGLEAKLQVKSLYSVFCLWITYFDYCDFIYSRSASSMAFWRVDNCFGSFILEDSENLHLVGKAYDLRHMLFKFSSDPSRNASSGTHYQNSQRFSSSARIEGDTSFSSGRFLEVVESPKLVWWNNGASSRKRLSIWRPDVPSGTVFLGDIAIQG